jgi:hypothetical protein
VIAQFEIDVDNIGESVRTFARLRSVNRNRKGLRLHRQKTIGAVSGATKSRHSFELAVVIAR